MIKWNQLAKQMIDRLKEEIKAGEIQGVVEIPLNAAIHGPSFILNPAFHTKTRTQVGQQQNKLGVKGCTISVENTESVKLT